MFEGQGVRKLRIPLYIYSVGNACETSKWRCLGGSCKKEFGESLSYRFELNEHIQSFKDFGVDSIPHYCLWNGCPITNYYMLFYLLLALIKSKINLVQISILKKSFICQKKTISHNFILLLFQKENNNPHSCFHLIYQLLWIELCSLQIHILKS